MAGGVKKSFSRLEYVVCKTTTPMFYPHSEREFNYILALLNSKITPVVLKAINPTLSVLTSDIMNLPYIYNQAYHALINRIVTECVHLAQSDIRQFETSWDFKRHPLLPKRDEHQEGES